MYETHFGFHRQPFQCADLSRTFYASESIRRILPQLLHSLRSSLGIALVTAPRGAGRTTLLRHIQSLFDQEARTVILPGAALETSADLQRALLLAALKHAGSPGQSLSADLTQAGRWNVIEQLRRTIEFWGPVIVLVDDCQLVPVSILNELRSFTEEEWNGRGLVRALVSAPMTFEEELARPVYADFSRRIRCHAFLQPLTTLESVEFLRRHIEAVGAKLPHVFSADAIELLTQACEGLPRSLALLADETLLGASELGRKPADGASVRGALSRLQHLPYHWNMPAESIHDVTESERSGVAGSATVEIATNAMQSTASHSAVVYQSAGVIEFGAPSPGAAEDSRAVGKNVDSTVAPLFSIESEDPQERGLTSELPLHVTMTSAVEPDTNLESDTCFEPETDFESETGTLDELRSEFEIIVTPSTTLIEVPDATHGSTSMITELPSLTPSAFEVGHRFIATSSNAESVGAVEPRQESTGVVADHFSNLESAESFVDLADEPRTVTYTQQPVQYFSNTPREDVSVGVDDVSSALSETVSFPDPVGRNHGTLSLQGFSSRIPVFDRYTWLGLGREVPAGRYSVTSSGAHGISRRMSVPQASGAVHTAHGLIPVVESTDAEIDRWLSGATPRSTEGEFLLVSPSISSQYESLETVNDVSTAADDAISQPFFETSPDPQAEDVAVGVEYYNNPMAQDESSRVTPVTIQDRIAAVVEVATAQLPASDASVPVLSEENRSLIRDALRTSLRAEIEAAIDSGVMQPPPLPATTSADTWADGSLVFGSRPGAQPDVTEAQAESDVRSFGQMPASTSSADRLFTIPVDLHSIDWDLRSSIMEFPEVAPLAQSVNELRSEVSYFHASGGGGNDASSSERTRSDIETDDESLLAKARRRLYTAALADIQTPSAPEGGEPQDGHLPEPVETVPAGSEADARFSTLFTRLRSMTTYRKDSVD